MENKPPQFFSDMRPPEEKWKVTNKSLLSSDEERKILDLSNSGKIHEEAPWHDVKSPEEKFGVTKTTVPSGKLEDTQLGGYTFDKILHAQKHEGHTTDMDIARSIATDTEVFLDKVVNQDLDETILSNPGYNAKMIDLEMYERELVDIEKDIQKVRDRIERLKQVHELMPEDTPQESKLGHEKAMALALSEESALISERETARREIQSLNDFIMNSTHQITKRSSPDQAVIEAN